MFSFELTSAGTLECSRATFYKQAFMMFCIVFVLNTSPALARHSGSQVGAPVSIYPDQGQPRLPLGWDIADVSISSRRPLEASEVNI